MAQTPALTYTDGMTIRYTPGSAVNAGDVVVIGSIPLISVHAIAANQLGHLTAVGVFKVPKTSDAFTAGDAVYWDVDGDPVDGTAGSGAADTSAATGELMGWATEDAGAEAEYVIVHLTSAKRTATLGGSVSADDIAGADAALNIDGLAAAQGGSIPIKGGTSSTGGNAGGAVSLTGGTGGAAGAGGAATVVGGIPASGNAAGGVATVAGGAGSGTGAGGATSITGGASGSGATGNGGAASVTGGAALSTNGTGGASSVTGGVGKGSGAGGAASLIGGAGGASGTGAGGAVTITGGASGTGATGNGGAVNISGGAASSTNGNGGSITLTPGALAGTGAPGKVHLDGFVHNCTAQTIAMNDAAVTLTRIPGTPTGTLLSGNWLLVDAESGTSEDLLLPPEADCADVLLFIKNTGGETINLQNDAGGALATIATSETCFAQCDGTDWTVMQHVFTT